MNPLNGLKACIAFATIAVAFAQLPEPGRAPEPGRRPGAEGPVLIHYPDRRPLISLFVAEQREKSIRNPRGYLRDSNLDVSDRATFRSRMLGWATEMKDRLDSRPVKPQGVIIWDIEGAEFDQPTSYIGDPRVLGLGYAPEMNDVADDLFATFRNAGYRVGVTIRPQHLEFGNALPRDCRYDNNDRLTDYFVVIGAPFGQKFYACSSPAGAWTLYPNGNRRQRFYRPQENQTVVDLLRAKAAYAQRRWKATLFYVDSTVYLGGQYLSADIFQSLQADFPGSLFVPEEGGMDDLPFAMPMSYPSAHGPDHTPPAWRAVYPAGAIAVLLNDTCADFKGAKPASISCWAQHSTGFRFGQRSGDVLIYPATTPLLMQVFETMIQAARSEASAINVTDAATGRRYKFTGRPNDIAAYPVKMRVYFAASPAGVATATEYCSSDQIDSCTFNLASMSVAQVRYYDFADTLVGSEAPQAVRAGGRI